VHARNFAHAHAHTRTHTHARSGNLPNPWMQIHALHVEPRPRSKP